MTKLRAEVVRFVLLAACVVLASGCRKNHAPDTPAVPAGPSSCSGGFEYTFSSSAADPDDDSVAIRFDWGGGDTSEWSLLVRSDITVSMSHTWPSGGTYEVRSQSQDRNGLTSTWSAAHTVVILSRWTRTYGGPEQDLGSSAQQTSDGGYLIAGSTSSFGLGQSLWLVKTDAMGHALWDRFLDGLNGSACMTRQTLDGGYVVVGSFWAQETYVRLVKVDADGNTLWAKTLGGSANQANCVQQTSDGGYIVAGSVYNSGGHRADFWLVKTDASGDTVWTRTYGGGTWAVGSSVQQTREGGYIATGTVTSSGTSFDDVWLIKTDENGDTVWTKALGGAGYDHGFSVRQTDDGGYVVGAVTSSAGYELDDAWLIKADANGDTVWTKTYGGPNDDVCYSVQQTGDGGYVLAGYTRSCAGGPLDAWLIKTDANGDAVWTRTYGGDWYDTAHSVDLTQDGGYIVAGSTQSFGEGNGDVWLIKTDAEGRVDDEQGK
jgi:TolB-like protein